jgi:hypothetical protein
LKSPQSRDTAGEFIWDSESVARRGSHQGFTPEVTLATARGTDSPAASLAPTLQRAPHDEESNSMLV